MSEPRQINGQCLCGSVTVTATLTDPIVRACHCDMCRRQTSSMFMSLPAENIVFSGPTKTYQSSEWAERAVRRFGLARQEMGILTRPLAFSTTRATPR